MNLKQSAYGVLGSARRRALAWLTLAALAPALVACGGSGSSSSSTASVRVANVTLTHASLNLLVDAVASTQATAKDTVSSYASVTSGARAFTFTDAGSTSTISSLTPTLTADSHYTLVAYESASTVKTILLSDNLDTPAAGVATLRLYNTATEAGKLDVYITSTPVTELTDVSTLSTTGSFSDTSAASAFSLSYGPGNYYVTVTGSGSPKDIRLLSMPLTLSGQQIATVLLTPASGGQLLDGALLFQQGAYSAYRNTGTRVRLASAVTGDALVAASASHPDGSSWVDPGSVAPQLGSYVLVPATSTLNVSVNGTPLGSATSGLVAGRDMTLLVYGSPSTAAATLLTDDNRPPSSSASVKLRLINGISGNSANLLTLTANSATVASSVQPYTASTYSAVTGSANVMNLTLYSSQKAGVYFTNTSYVLNANSVYTVLAAGDFAAPMLLIR
jgi:hypothetical protein